MAKKIEMKKELKKIVDTIGDQLKDMIENSNKILKTYKAKKEWIAASEELTQLFDEIKAKREEADKKKKKFWKMIEKDLKFKEGKKGTSRHLYWNDENNTVELHECKEIDGIGGIIKLG